MKVRPVRRYVSIVAFGLATLLLTAGPASAATTVNYSGSDNLVQLENDNPARQAVSTASAVSFDSGNDPVTNGNLAYSRSFDCTGCRTVTVAVQVVVLQGNPTDIQPANAAVALNENCQFCQTFAYAHQYLMSPHHQVALGKDTKQRLQYIQSAIDYVANSGKDFPTMSGQLDQLSWAFCYTVQQAVQGDEQGSSPTPNVCGVAPFDHRQVEPG